MGKENCCDGMELRGMIVSLGSMGVNLKMSLFQEY